MTDTSVSDYSEKAPSIPEGGFSGDMKGLQEAAEVQRHIRETKVANREPFTVLPDNLVNDFKAGLELAVDPDQVADPELTKVIYKERPGPEGVSPKKAAEDYSRFRTERAAEILRGLDDQIRQEQEQQRLA